MRLRARTCLVLFASSAGLLDRLAPAALLLRAGRSSRGRSNSSLRSRGKLLYLQEEQTQSFRGVFKQPGDARV